MLCSRSKQSQDKKCSILSMFFIQGKEGGARKKKNLSKMRLKFWRSGLFLPVDLCQIKWLFSSGCQWKYIRNKYLYRVTCHFLWVHNALRCYNPWVMGKYIYFSNINGEVFGQLFRCCSLKFMIYSLLILTNQVLFILFPT